MDIEKINLKAHVEPIIKKAGELVLTYFSKARSLKRNTKDMAGFFTEADLASEKFLIENLSKILPDAAFYAEESGASGSSDFCWVIDPIDGTTNFAHGLPHFCISLALTHKEKPIFGIIYNPVLDELFWAELDKGAWLNDQKIEVVKPTAFDQSLLVVGFPYKGIDDEYNRFMRQVADIAPKAYTFRNLGAAALDLAYVACGRFDGIFCSRMQWWDFAAGSLLVEQSGGVITDFQGRLLRPDSQSFVAGGQMVHKALLGFLGK